MSGIRSELIIEAAVAMETAIAEDKERGIRRSLFEPSLAAARASLDAGAAIIHHHHDRDIPVEEQIDQCVRMSREILATHPHALIYPAPLMDGQTHREMNRHYDALAAAGLLTMITIEMGRTLFPVCDETGLPSGEWVNGAKFSDAHELVMLAKEHDVPMSFGIYTPSMAYWIREYTDRGLIPAGSIVKIWLGGRYRSWSNQRPTVRHTLAPTVKTLDAYLEALEGVNLPWMVSVQGDNILDTAVIRYALEQGGHVRVGEEDVSGATPLKNVQLVEAAGALGRSMGRAVVSGAEARTFLGVKPVEEQATEAA